MGQGGSMGEVGWGGWSCGVERMRDGVAWCVRKVVVEVCGDGGMGGG